MKATDILPGNTNEVVVDGMQLRKGSVAAFLANLAVIEQPAGYPDYEAAVQDLLELTPVLDKLGLFRHFALRSAKAAAIIADVYPHLKGRI